jgi:hypothetical protein
VGHIARRPVRYHVRDPAEVGPVVRPHLQPQEALSLHASDLLRVVTRPAASRRSATRLPCLTVAPVTDTAPLASYNRPLGEDLAYVTEHVGKRGGEDAV